MHVAEKIRDLQLEYGRHFESLNSVILLLSWRLIGTEWVTGRKLKTTELDSFGKSLDETFERFAARWILLSQWAGRWGASSGKVMAGYASQLAKDWEKIRGLDAPKDVLDVVSARMSAWIDDLVPDAVAWTKALDVDRRGDVRQYFTALWVWHRLDQARWKLSATPLKLKKSRAVEKLHVDHLVAWGHWEKHLAPVLGDPDHYDGGPNEIGNCVLLWKNFNISKSDKPLATFLKDLHEVGKDPAWQGKLCTAIEVDSVMLDPTGKVPKDIAAAVTKRTESIKSALEDFVRGNRQLN